MDDASIYLLFIYKFHNWKEYMNELLLVFLEMMVAASLKYGIRALLWYKSLINCSLFFRSSKATVFLFSFVVRACWQWVEPRLWFVVQPWRWYGWSGPCYLRWSRPYLYHQFFIFIIKCLVTISCLWRRKLLSESNMTETLAL